MRGLWRLPPWSRAPLLGLRSRAAVVAVLVPSAILTCAVASAPLFLSPARSAALQQQLAPQCAEAAWPQIGSFAAASPDTAPAELADYADSFEWTASGRSSEPVLQVTRATGSGGNAQFGMLVRDPTGEPLTQPANLFWRPGVTAHIEKVEGSDTAGVWLPASYAEAAHAAVGDSITMSGAQVTVAGVYTDLFETDPGAFWCDYQRLFLNLASANTPPPALVLAADEDTFFRLAAAAGFFSVQQQVPTDASTLSVTDARALLADQDRAQVAAVQGDPVQPATNQRLADAVDRAQTIERGLQGPVLPVAIAGGLLALVLVAAAGSLWADRPATQVRLLAARGVGPVPLAGKAAPELALPPPVGPAGRWGGPPAALPRPGPPRP